MRWSHTPCSRTVCETFQEQLGVSPILAELMGSLDLPDAAAALLEEGGVASIPGTAFYRGATGEKLLRFCYAKEQHVLEEACARVRNFRG